MSRTRVSAAKMTFWFRMLCGWVLTLTLTLMMYFKGQGDWGGVHMGLAYAAIMLATFETACGLYLRHMGIL